MFGTSGIRGTVGETVTAELALQVGRALSADADRVVVGRDARTSGPVLADALAAGLRECGTDVVRLGLVSTPTVARSVAWQDADAGVSVTASHNSAPDNGLKLWTPSGQAYDPATADAVARRIREGDVDPAAWDGLGEQRRWDRAGQRHVDHLARAFDRLSDLAVVVDLGNGTGRVTVDALYELGCTVDTLNAQPDGRFPARESEPNEETLGRLCDTVAGTDADLGIAHDGDSDRMVAVDETGRFVPKDQLLALFARDAVARGEAERVAIPVDTSLLVSDVVEDAGGSVAYTPVGDVHVAERTREAGFGFGGEPSGAWIWPAETLCPDGHYAACRLATIVDRADAVSDLLSAFDRYRYETRRTNVHTDEKTAAMEAVEAAIAEQYDDVRTLDGVRVDAEDGWFLIRASGTEPVVRVTAEAREAAAADRLLDAARGVVEDAVGA